MATTVPRSARRRANRGGGRVGEGARSGHPERSGRAAETRRRWLETLARYRCDPERPGTADYWSPTLDRASRDELIAIQNAKLAASVPFLHENSAFYRRRFAR